MQNRARQNDPSCPLWLKLLAGVLLVVGLVFRFSHLDRKEKLERGTGYRVEAVDPLSGLWRLVK
jgi:hypothetical protein